MDTQTKYGLNVKYNSEYEGTKAIYSDEKLKLNYANKDITVGDKIVHRRGTIQTATYTATATALATTTDDEIINEITARVKTLITEIGLPTDGSTQVKLSELDVTPEEARSISIEAEYLPHAKANG